MLFRSTTSARFRASHDWSVRVGYSSFLRGHDFVRLGWQRALSGGVSYPVGTPKLMGSTIYEHHWLPADLGERNRLRQRFEFTWPKKKVAPWAYEDLTMENGRGFYRSRSRVGLLWDLPGAWQLRTGYQFQTIKQPATGMWAPRHAILLQLRTPALFDLRGRRKKKPAEPEQQLEDLQQDRKSTRLNSSHIQKSRMPSSA